MKPRRYEKALCLENYKGFGNADVENVQYGFYSFKVSSKQ